MDEKKLNTDIFGMLRRNWMVVLISFFSVILTVGFFTATTEPVYEASATISMREWRDDVTRRTMDLPNVLLQKYLVKNQVAILESRRLAVNVVKILQESVYKDSLRLLGNGPKTKETSLRERLFSWMKKKDTEKKKKTFQEMIKKFKAQTKVSYGRESDIVELKAKAASPWEAACIVNSWVESYEEYNRSDNQLEKIQTRQSLETKLAERENQLNRSQDRLTEYKKREKVVSLSSEMEQLIIQIAHLQSLYDETMTELESLENQLGYLKNQLTESRKNIASENTNNSSPVLQGLLEQLKQKVNEKVTYEAQLIGAGIETSWNDKLTRMENQIAMIQEKINEEKILWAEGDMTVINPAGHLENILTQIFERETMREALTAKQKVLKIIIEEKNKALETLPDKSRALAELERDVQINEKLYILLKEKFEEEKIKEVDQVGVIRVVDYAMPPTRPVYPKTSLNLFLGCVFGLLLGLGFAFGRDYMDDSIRDSDDLKTMGIQLIGNIPIVKKEHIRTFHKNGDKDWKIVRARNIYPYLLIHQNGNSVVAESYKAVRTSIYQMSIQNHVKTILLTSPGPSEGKSTTAANLAITMAQKGVKTLLVDSDLRRPVLDFLFMGSHRRIGLTNYLGREVKWQDAVRETAVKGLHLLSAGVGVKNASEVLGSKSMVSLIQEAKKEYGLIIFDSPPLLPVTDAAVLASIIDGIVLIVKADKTMREDVRHSLDLLNNMKTKFMGVVLTGVKSVGHYKYRDYY